jgi:hypothetical protein
LVAAVTFGELAHPFYAGVLLGSGSLRNFNRQTPGGAIGNRQFAKSEEETEPTDGRRDISKSALIFDV